MNCTCADVEIGSYGNQISVPYPSHITPPPDCNQTHVCLDKCISDEVRSLWEQGIKTTGCCCGHGKLEPFIGVAPSDIPRMKSLGYLVAPNPSRPGDEDSFYPLGY